MSGSGPEPGPHRVPRSAPPSDPESSLTMFLALVVLGGLATVLVVSIPVAIQIRLALAPAE